jgi:rhodanese-related sulfurtransferase
MSAVPEMTVQELSGCMAANDDILVIDVREPEEYEICSIQGSKLIPLSSLPQHAVDLPKDKLLVMQCHHGRRSAQAVQYLLQNGHTNVVNLTGGIHAWTIEIDPTLKTY